MPLTRILTIMALTCISLPARETPEMYYCDTSHGKNFAKDPDVVRFKKAYFMYYSMHRGDKGFAVGIAKSSDLANWKKAGELLPGAPYEKRGLAAPAAIVFDGKVHLFYQTYGNRRKDAICHATSDDGIVFTRNKTNPIFSPTGSWNCGRAIDADVIVFRGKMLLYFATRDPSFKIQKVGVASAPLEAGFVKDSWTQRCDSAILEPELPWEKRCIEASAVCEYGGKLFMFYAGAYNNEPQQIGCAVSNDGISWKRLSKEPLLPNGKSGEWNSSESGHPGIFVDDDEKMYLFFQGNDDRGKSWYLSKMDVRWKDGEPSLVRPRDGHVYTLKK